MSNVNTEKNDELKELSFQMMIIENQKLQEENMESFSERKNKSSWIDPQIKENHYRILMRLDMEGYSLSLQFNDKLHKLGYDHNGYKIGPDATYTSAENLLNKYGLNYPKSWRIASETREGLVFSYFPVATIDRQKEDFLKSIVELRKNNKISEAEERRLMLAAQYFAAHHKLLSCYHNNEEINTEEIIQNIGKAR